MQRWVSAVSLSALVLALSVPTVSAQDTKIGVTAVVNPNATGKTPSQSRRTLLVGSDVFSQENVITTENGQAQMLFLDESALTIGPNSEVVLDEFVYDPNTKTGKLVLTATKGPVSAGRRTHQQDQPGNPENPDRDDRYPWRYCHDQRS